MNRRRELLPEGGQQITDGIHHSNGVGTGLSLDCQRNHLLAVVTRCEAIVLNTVNDVAEILQVYRSSIPVSNNQLSIGIGICELTIRLDRECLMNAVDRSDR